MTTTDDDLIDLDDENPSERPDWKTDDVRRRDPAPCAAFDGLTQPDEINRRFREGWAFASLVYGDRFKVPYWFTAAWGEELRRAFVRHVAIRDNKRGARGPSVPRVIQEEAKPVEHEDGSLTIVCVTCNTEKPVNKFPTLKGGKGHRGTTCRECRDRAWAEKKAAKRA